jgi:hypothetical protein
LYGQKGPLAFRPTSPVVFTSLLRVILTAAGREELRIDVAQRPALLCLAAEGRPRHQLEGIHLIHATDDYDFPDIVVARDGPPDC